MTERAPSSFLQPDTAGITEAAAILARGELLAFPSETVYGLGADAEDVDAVMRIYEAKGRPATHPVIVHISPDSDPGYWVHQLPHQARLLIDAFWPGPLTLILKRAAHIPDVVSGGQDSLGLRCPSHPVAQALLRAFDQLREGHGGVAGPSANRFGHVSPTTAQHVREEFGEAIPILDGGSSKVGIESTILDLSRGFPALLRPGHLTPQQLAAVLGEMPRLPDGTDASAPRASGTLKAHYATRTPLALLSADDIGAMAIEHAGERMAIVARRSAIGDIADLPNVVFVAAPEDPSQYAQALYGLLRQLDRADLERILIERLPASPEWAAVNDRLGRAAAAFDDGLPVDD
jgi:L-threonylcarbamoyladenylate synthase